MLGVSRSSQRKLTTTESAVQAAPSLSASFATAARAPADGPAMSASTNPRGAPKSSKSAAKLPSLKLPKVEGEDIHLGSLLLRIVF